MLTAIQGVYRGGQIVLPAIPGDVRDETPVIVTFLEPNAIDLRARGIDEAQAADLRARLATFAEEWESPEMDGYDTTACTEVDRVIGSLPMVNVDTALRHTLSL